MPCRQLRPGLSYDNVLLTVISYQSDFYLSLPMTTGILVICLLLVGFSLSLGLGREVLI